MRFDLCTIDWNAVSAILASIALVFTVVFAVWQTRKAHTQADKANELTEKVVHLEKNKIKPYLLVVTFGTIPRQIENSDVDFVEFTIKNYAEYPACDVTFSQLEIYSVKDGKETLEHSEDLRTSNITFSRHIMNGKEAIIKYPYKQVFQNGVHELLKFRVQYKDISGTCWTTIVSGKRKTSSVTDVSMFSYKIEEVPENG